ncbi:MAG: UDP-N-acetylmuramoylalanine-D-glutamate ligase [uncultured bacterium]|nr:MAG: UDP-N-acetylmuramoylalanine-D-glutamate ligase [uncultured bacterium]
MNTSFFKGKKITVFGLGLHGGGVGTVKFLSSCGAKVIVTDIKTREQLAPSLEKLKDVKNIQYVLGQHRPEDFTKVDMVIKTPGASWTDKNVKLALDAGVPVEIDSSIFFKLCKNPIIGVTGSKGKTTIATFIYEIIKSSGKNVIKVGIGQISVLDKLALLKKDSVVVFELSSWRLSALGRNKLSPHIAVFKNILRDHLNYYKTMNDYIEDKKNIFLFQKPKDWLVINQDDEKVVEAAKTAPSQMFRFSYSPIKDKKSVFVENEAVYLNNGIDVKKIANFSDIKIPGRHNLSNIMAAISACYVFGLNINDIKKAIPNLKGVLHRLEFVREFKGVRYYNDTAATIPDATISALNSFEQPIILIAGGTDKGLDFSELSNEILQKTKKVVLLKGNATDDLLIKIEKNNSIEKVKEIEVVDSMEKAMEIAVESGAQGDVVLLSPGAASFGLFLNEFDRGDKFKEAVGKLK